MSASAERAMAYHAAQVDWQKGLERARKISDPWYRCQSLAEVVRHAPDGEVNRLATEALKTAQLCPDDNRRVSVSTWPLRAMMERGKQQQAERVTGELLGQANGIEHQVRRLDALAMLWEAARGLPQQQAVLDTLIATCNAAPGWKATYVLKAVVIEIAQEDVDKAQHIIDSMRETQGKRQAQRRVEAIRRAG